MIKLVAFDMDGTFLNRQNDYDRTVFAEIFKKLRARDIEVVAISGNQYHQIKSFFPELLEEMTIVSEIGCKIYEYNHLIAEERFELAIVEEIIQLLAEKQLLDRCAVNGLDTLYFQKSAPEDFKKTITKHNFSWKEVDSLLDLPEDDFSILTLDLPGQDIHALIHELNSISGKKAKAVSSGFAFIDIIMPEVNKGTALQFLGKRWGIKPEEMMAFGDSGNDLEMLEYVGRSYAMEGSPAYVQEAAKFQAPSNDLSGVLVVLEDYLSKEENATN